MANDYRQQRLEENRKVRAALKGAGFAARVGHGTGTAYGWLDITIIGRSFDGETYNRILLIAKEASGRSAWSAENMSVNFTQPVEKNSLDIKSA